MNKKRSVAQFGNPFEQEEREIEVIEEKVEEQQKDHQPDIETNPSNEDNKESSDGFLDQFFEKKETVEDTHTRKTFLIENDLLKEIKRYTSKLGYGFQTKFINEAIKRQLELIKEDEKRLKGKRRK